MPGWRACRSTLHSWAGWAGSLAPCNRIPRKEEARKALSAVVFIKAVVLTPKQHQRLLRAPVHLQPPGRRQQGREGGREWALDSLPDNKCFQVPGEHAMGHSRI